MTVITNKTLTPLGRRKMTLPISAKLQSYRISENDMHCMIIVKASKTLATGKVNRTLPIPYIKKL